MTAVAEFLMLEVAASALLRHLLHKISGSRCNGLSDPSGGIGSTVSSLYGRHDHHNHSGEGPAAVAEAAVAAYNRRFEFAHGWRMLRQKANRATSLEGGKVGTAIIHRYKSARRMSSVQ